MMQKRLLTPKDVAELLQISVRTLERWVAEGKLPAIRLGRLIRFDPDDIRKFIDERKEEK